MRGKCPSCRGLNESRIIRSREKIDLPVQKNSLARKLSVAGAYPAVAKLDIYRSLGDSDFLRHYQQQFLFILLCHVGLTVGREILPEVLITQGRKA